MMDPQFIFVAPIIGIIDAHCENCGSFEFIQSAGYHNCQRCGHGLTTWAPSQQKAEAREAWWLMQNPEQKPIYESNKSEAQRVRNARNPK